MALSALQFRGKCRPHRPSLPFRCDRSCAMLSESASPSARSASRSARWRSPPACRVPQACALSLLMFTGASQFAFVGLIGGGAAAAVATALLLGGRNALYGLRLAPLPARRAALAAHLVIDESAAMAVRDTPADTRLGFWSTGLAVFVLLEPRDADRRAGRQRALRPARARPRRRRAGRVPRAARAAAAGARAAGDRRLAPWRRWSRCRSCPRACRCWWPRRWRWSPRWRAAVRARWAGRPWPARARRVRGSPAGAAARDVGRDPDRRRRAATRSSSPGSRCRSACSTAPRVQRVALLLPVALLAALIAMQTFGGGRRRARRRARRGGRRAAAAGAVPRRRRRRRRPRPRCCGSRSDARAKLVALCPTKLTLAVEERVTCAEVRVAVGAFVVDAVAGAGDPHDLDGRVRGGQPRLVRRR